MKKMLLITVGIVIIIAVLYGCLIGYSHDKKMPEEYYETAPGDEEVMGSYGVYSDLSSERSAAAEYNGSASLTPIPTIELSPTQTPQVTQTPLPSVQIQVESIPAPVETPVPNAPVIEQYPSDIESGVTEEESM